MDKFKNEYTPDKRIAIDEELLLWKGRLGFKQYIPDKRARFWNQKCFQFCEIFGYIWNSFRLFREKMLTRTLEEQAFVKELGKRGAILPKLMSDLYGNGYHLYVDNWYTSERLFKHLSENGTVCLR